MTGQHKALLSGEFQRVLLVSGDDAALGHLAQVVALVLPEVDVRSINPDREPLPAFDDTDLIILALGKKWARIVPELMPSGQSELPPCIGIDYAPSINRAVDVMRQGAADYIEGTELNAQRLTDALVQINSAEVDNYSSAESDSAVHDRTEILSTIDHLVNDDVEKEKTGVFGHITQIFNNITAPSEEGQPGKAQAEPTVQLSGEAVRKIQEQALGARKESGPDDQARSVAEAELQIEELPDVEERYEIGPHTEKSPHVGNLPRKGHYEFNGKDTEQGKSKDSAFSGAWIRQSDTTGGRAWPFTAEDIEQGEAFLGNYRVLAFLGVGGMASVFKAQRMSDDRLFAIKLLDPSMSDHNVKERFKLEFEILQSIKHKHVVSMEEQVEDGELIFTVMEYLPGGDLKSRIRRSLNRQEAVRYASQIAAALYAAHQHGVLHRDLKPANVLFRSDGALALVDFGVAKDTKGQDRELTREGQMVGTPFYASPEQATGSKMDQRSDLYALGVIFYEMLQGCRPFVGDTSLQVLMAHVKDPIPLLPAELDDLNDVLAQLLAKKPSDRFADGNAVVEALAESSPRDVPQDLLGA